MSPAWSANDHLTDQGNGHYALSGHSNYDNVGPLLAHGRRQFGEHRDISIDLANADCANTAGLALLMEWSTWCQAKRINLVYHNPQSRLLEVVDANNVRQLMPFSPSSAKDPIPLADA